MTTRNLVPRSAGEGKIGISTKKWAEVNAESGLFGTLKVTNLKLDAVADLSLFTNGAGIKDIATNASGQFVIAMDDSFLADDLGYVNGEKPDFEANGTVLAGDSFVTAINKLDAAVSNVADPANLDVTNFANAALTTSAEVFADNDTTLMTSAAIDDHIRSFGFTSNSGDITEVSAGAGLSGGGASGAVTLSIADQLDANNGGFDAGTFGSASAVPQITVNQKGIITGITTQNVATTLNINGDNNVVNNIEVELLSDVLDFTGSGGITTAASENQIAITLGNTGVTAGNYGSATTIPTFTVDQQGRLTAAGTATISTTLNILSDDGGNANPVELADDTLSLLGGTGITSTNAGDAVTFNLDNTAVTAGNYGDENSVAQFTVDAQGRLIAAANVDISITSSQVSDATSANTASTIVERDGSGNFNAGTISATLAGNAATASAWQNSATITLGTDLVGSVSLDGSQDVTLNATIAADSVVLGTNTTGDYVATITAGTGLTSTGAVTGESIAHQISVSGVLEDLVTLGEPDSDGQFIVATGAGTFAYESGATARSSLELGDLSPLAGNTGLSVSNNLLIDNAKELRLGELDTNGTEYIAIKSPDSIANSYTLTFPDAQGADGTVLVTDANGNLAWSTVEAAAGAAVNAFSIISVDTDGQANLVADASQDTLNISEGTGISLATDANTDTLTISIDTSDLTTLSALTSAGAADSTLAVLGNMSISQDLTVSGDLVVAGNSTTVNTQTLTVEDPLIKLASGNNASDAVDIGFYGLYDSAGNQDLYSGLFRDASDGKYKLFKDLQAEPTTTVNLAGAGYTSATLVADLEGDVTGQVSSLANHTTTNLTEGNNLYFTQERARGVVSASDAGGDGSFTYDAEVGQFTYTGPSAAETRAHFSGGTGVTITDGEVAIGQAVETNSNVTFSSVAADLTGNVTGNADTATTLANDRAFSIGAGPVRAAEVNFNGSGAVSLTSTIADDQITNAMLANESIKLAIGVDEDFDQDVSLGGTFKFIAGSSNLTISSDAINGGFEFDIAPQLTNVNASTATTLETTRAFSIGAGPVRAVGVNFDGSGAVSLTSTIADGAILHEMIEAAIPDSSLATISTADKVSSSSINISGATELANEDALTLSDLLLFRDTSVNTNKKATLTQLTELLQSANVITSLPTLATVGTISTGVWNGTAITDANIANDLTISGGTVNDTVVGGVTPAAGTFTTLVGNTSLTINGTTTVTQILDEDNMASDSATSLATQQSIKAYVDAQITTQDLDIQGDAGGALSISLDSETLTITGGTGIDTSGADNTITVSIDNTVTTLAGEQTLTNKTLTSPVVSGLTLSDSSIVFEGATPDDFETTLSVEDPTADRTVTIPNATDTLVGRSTTDTLANKSIDANTNTITNLEVDNLKAGVLDTSLAAVSANDDTLPSAKAVKSYVDGKIGRFGGIFKTDSVDANDIYDVIFDSSPLVRSHFGPFAFDLGQLVSSGGSDITFFGATAFGASDRHFEVMPVTDVDDDTYGENETVKGHCLFTGADADTP